jgi:hypothetical protein
MSEPVFGKVYSWLGRGRYMAISEKPRTNGETTITYIVLDERWNTEMRHRIITRGPGVAFDAEPWSLVDEAWEKL